MFQRHCWDRQEKNKELGLPGVSWVQRNKRQECPWLIPHVQGFTEQQKKLCYCIEVHLGFSDPLLDIPVSLKFRFVWIWEPWKILAWSNKCPFPRAGRKKGELIMHCKKFGLLHKLHPGWRVPQVSLICFVLCPERKNDHLIIGRKKWSSWLRESHECNLLCPSIHLRDVDAAQAEMLFKV